MTFSGILGVGALVSFVLTIVLALYQELKPSVTTDILTTLSFLLCVGFILGVVAGITWL